MQMTDRSVTIKGRSLKIKMTLKKIPVKAAIPMARRRKMRNERLEFMSRILRSVKKRAKGPEKRILPIMKETTRARDSMAFLSKIRSWPPLVI
jgi:hypothetical protein